MVAVIEAEERVNAVHIEGLVSTSVFGVASETIYPVTLSSCRYSHFATFHMLGLAQDCKTLS